MSPGWLFILASFSGLVKANPVQFNCNKSASADGYILTGQGFCTGITTAAGGVICDIHSGVPPMHYDILRCHVVLCL